jgi:alpha-glucosidase
VAVYLRTEPDGEQHLAKMERGPDDALSQWWEADLLAKMPSNPYRFKLITGEGVWHLNALGLSQAERPNALDFKLLADYPAPRWIWEAAFYQIFPDRFANGDPSLTPKPGDWERKGHQITNPPWEEIPGTWGQRGSLDFYGGDLPGIEQQLDYLRDLGVTGLYLTPIFTAHTNHRYDIQDFMAVDPHLGGDAALISLRKAMAQAGMRLILDVTPNHLSDQHPWFTAAQADPAAETSEFFTFYDDTRQDYECWMGVKQLVKLNYSSQKLRDWFYRRPDSVLRHWLADPFSIDGWRLDVLNMTARQGSLQLQREVGREMRAAVKAQNPEAYLMGEHFFDGTPHLQGDELDGVMNYQGFNMPLRRWLAGDDLAGEWVKTGDLEEKYKYLSTEALREQLQTYLAAVPFVMALQQFNQLGSHDTPRFLHLVGGDKDLLKLATALLFTYIGVPCLYYGDEVGMTGGRDPDNRRGMAWGHFDEDLLAYHKKLIALRKESPALQTGGLQWLRAEGDILAFQRQAPGQQIVVIANRGPAVRGFRLPLQGAGLSDGQALREALSGQGVVIQGGVAEIDLPAQSAWIGQAIS